MARGLQVDPRDAVPIWKQIEDGVRGLIVSGALRPGGAVPSVRDLARELRVNPATVVRAYQRLTEAGLLAVRRGEGTFVAEEPPTPSRADRGRALHEGAHRYATLALSVGAARAEAASAFHEAYDRLRPAAGGEKP